MSKKIYMDIKQIKRLYWEKGWSLRQISKEVSCCMATVKNFMKRHNIPRRKSRYHFILKPKKEELEDLYKNSGLDIKDFCKKLNCGHVTLYRWLKGYNIKPCRRLKYKKKPFSGDKQEKAYIYGICLGDFHVCKQSRQICVQLSTTHPSMIRLFYDLFQRYGSPYKYSKYNKVTERYGWALYVLLDRSFEFLLHKPEKIMKNDNFYSFLAGFFDAEGCLHIYNNKEWTGLSFSLYNNNEKVLKMIDKYLREAGFNTKFGIISKKNSKIDGGYYQSKDVFYIRMYNIKEIIKLLKVMPLKHGERHDKINIALKILENNKWIYIEKDVLGIRDKIKADVRNCVIEAENDWGGKQNKI